MRKTKIRGIFLFKKISPNIKLFSVFAIMLVISFVFLAKFFCDKPNFIAYGYFNQIYYTYYLEGQHAD